MRRSERGHNPPRLDRDWGNAFGTLPAGVDTGAIIGRHAVRI